LFDVYLTWARIEKQAPFLAASGTLPNGDANAAMQPSLASPSLSHAAMAAARTGAISYMASRPIGLQYMFFRK
jgi:hypothetical protein